MGEETSKQRQERLMAECLLKALGLHAGAWRPCDPPRTDILLDLGSGESVALEVRGLTDPVRQESLSTRRRIGQAAEAALQGRRVNAHVAWRSGSPIPSKDDTRLGKHVASAVKEMLASGRNALGEWDEIPSALAPYVEAIHLFPAERDGPHVHTSLESWEGSGSALLVQSALDDKEGKLPSYRRAHPDTSVWLLLWTSAGESQPVTTRSLPRAHVYHSGFSRVFVLDYPQCSVSELNLSRGL